MRKGSIKNTRINNEIMKELSIMIHGELSDPRISSFANVSYVETATDLKTCKVSISVLGASNTDKKDTIIGLNSAKGYLRRELARRINLRNTPELFFELDEGLEYGNHLMELIDKVSKNDNKN